MEKKVKILCIAGTRPNFIKIAPLVDEMKKHIQIQPILVNTGQHYDLEMSQIFFQELKIPKYHYNLNIGSGSHAEQTSKALLKLEPLLLKEKPDLIVVIGDVNSTLAAALAAAKLHIPIAHVEAGPRSYDKRAPEEINRIIVDHISDILLCPTKKSVDNLKAEGIGKKVYNTGDLMYDISLKGMRIALEKASILDKLSIEPNRYYLLTMHRAENTDSKKRLSDIIEAASEIGSVVFPCHPRTEKYLKRHNIWDKANKKIKIIKPLGYVDMLSLEKNAEKIITDSGGIQKEAFWFKKPCITLMESSGWQETVEDGWNILVGANKKMIIEAVKNFNPRKKQHKHFGGGKAAQKIVKILLSYSKGGNRR